MNYEFDEMMGRFSAQDQMRSRLTSVKEGRQMTWEQIATALYDILDNIDTAGDMAKGNHEAYRNMVEKLQQEKNRYMCSPDGYGLSRVNEGLVDHAKREIALAGLSDSDCDYDGMIGQAVLELMETFAAQGHSGFSAQWVLDVFERLANWKALTELTNDPDEWNDVSEMAAQDVMFQSCRNPEAFSHDGGKTYYLLSEAEEELEDVGDDGEPYTYRSYNPDLRVYHTAATKEV